MTRLGSEVRAGLSRRLGFLKDAGRCATCPWVVGATVKPGDLDGSSQACTDHRYARFAERVPDRSPGGYSVYANTVDYCFRDEIATSTNIMLRPTPQELTWRQIGGRLLRYPFERVGQFMSGEQGAALAASAAACANVVLYDSYVVGAYTVNSGSQPTVSPEQ